MKKKISLILVLLIVSLLPLFSLVSCNLNPMLRPSGTYSSYTYTNPEDENEYRFLVKFQEEKKRGDFVSGKLTYAYQIKVKNRDTEWKTSKIVDNLTYKIQSNKKNGENLIEVPDNETMKVVSYGNDTIFNCKIASYINNVKPQNLYFGSYKFTGYTLQNTDDPFPTAVSDFSKNNTKNNN